MMRAFVTGAASPLGRALTTALVKRGDKVVGLVRRRSGVTLLKNLGVQPVLGDLTDPQALVKAMQGCDAVFHVASFFDFWSPTRNTYEKVNVEGAKNVIAAAIIAKIPRLVFPSSTATIGELPGETGTEWTQHRGYTVTAFEESK